MPTHQGTHVLTCTPILRRCVVLDDETVRCFGAGLYGRLGSGGQSDVGGSRGQMGDVLPPVDLGGGFRAWSVSATSGHTCVIGRDGGEDGERGTKALKCFGRNIVGQVRGRASFLHVVELPHTCLSLSVALFRFAMCMRSRNRLIGLALSHHATQLGLGDNADRGDEPGEMGDSLPAVALAEGEEPLQVSLGTDHTCLLTDMLRAACWGENSYGQVRHMCFHQGTRDCTQVPPDSLAVKRRAVCAPS